MYIYEHVASCAVFSTRNTIARRLIAEEDSVAYVLRARVSSTKNIIIIIITVVFSSYFASFYFLIIIIIIIPISTVV